MKKTIMIIAIVLGTALGAMAQNGGGLFQYGAVKDDYNGIEPTRDGLISLPTSHGQDTDADAPLGSGIAVLIGLGAAYAFVKKHEEE